MLIHRGQSYIETVVGADPAAGAEATITVPAGESWILRSFALTLVTAIAVATRQVTLRITDGTSELAAAIAGDTQIESLTRDYVFAVGGAAFASTARPTGNTVIGAALPELTLPPGSVIETLTDAIQAADDFSVPTLLVEKFR